MLDERWTLAVPPSPIKRFRDIVAKDLLQSDLRAERLKALSEPLRLRIVDALRGGPQNVTDLAEKLQVEVVTLSHHLGILRNARLLIKERHGRFIVYSLHPDVFQREASTKAIEHIDLGCCRLEIPRGR
jgi:DNA-binding transcriptional ArsR family regulator